jgi:hypothetical protein
MQYYNKYRLWILFWSLMGQRRRAWVWKQRLNIHVRRDVYHRHTFWTIQSPKLNDYAVKQLARLARWERRVERVARKRSSRINHSGGARHRR